MIERILFFTNYNQYNSKRHFAKKFAEALRRSGISTYEMDIGQGQLNRAHLDEIEAFDPTFTASFHSFIPSSNKKFLWDFLKRTHLEILVDPALYSVSITASPYVVASCVDLFDVEGFSSFGFQRAFFLPHAVEKELCLEKTAEKPLDVVFIGSCYDYESLKQSYEKKLGEGAKAALEMAIELVLNDNLTPLHKALVESWNYLGLSPQGINFEQLFNYLDLYTRGFDRIQLIRAIPDDVDVHVFGANGEGDFIPKKSWNHYLGDKKNIHIHEGVGFVESMEILKKSKICLNSSPFFKNGTHERIFTGPALGALAVTTDNQWVRKNFIDGEDIILVPPKGWPQAGEQIKRVLQEPQLLSGMVTKAKAKVLAAHTWDVRAQTLIEKMPSFLDEIAKANR